MIYQDAPFKTDLKDLTPEHLEKNKSGRAKFLW
jgi:hypothetical protein